MTCKRWMIQRWLTLFGSFCRLLGQGASILREKSTAAYGAAKESKAGSAVADGLNRAAAAGSEQIGKLKETEAYKKSSSFASTQLERTSVVASGALEAVRHCASQMRTRWSCSCP